MTQQDDITQPVLTDDDLLRICQQFNPGQDLDLAKAVRAALLSKVRAPVADERAQLHAIVALADEIFPCLTIIDKREGAASGATEKIHDLANAIKRAALASAPVAREALGWRVRERRSDDGKLLDCFVEAPAAPGMAYAQEVLGDDYAEAQGGIEGKLKHCQMIVAWANAAPQASEAVLHTILHSVRQARIAGNDWRRELALIENTVDAALSAQPGAQKESRDE
ncbi:hypothetical protein [Achromobacter xylosoxidans]|uniref:hypothetical protein n=1 Tax=Alcaligenes xylosoxydans xylosoxydans TaxID=85698 RepID=UPI000B48F794|nr:hypothetical protein [Achromobacter xylosoxidans]